jgi:hypothetical protein
MKIDITNISGVLVAEIISESLVIADVSGALDLIGNCGYQDVENIIIHAGNITPAFFDLKTGIAGEILQKFSTYRMKLAIVGDFSKYTSKSLKDFIYESNKTGRINFVNSVKEAKEKLSKQ